MGSDRKRALEQASQFLWLAGAGYPWAAGDREKVMHTRVLSSSLLWGLGRSEPP